MQTVRYLLDVVTSLENESLGAEDARELQERLKLVNIELQSHKQTLGSDYELLARRVEAVAKRLASRDAPLRSPAKQRVLSPVSESDIRETFYAKMIELAAISEECRGLDLRKDDVKVLLSAKTIVSALRDSEGVDGIRLHNGNILTQDNCPSSYQRMAAAMLQMKPAALNMPDAALEGRINDLAKAICSLEHFKEIINQVALDVEEVKGTVASSHAPTPESLQGVTEELIQRTFYQTMLDHTTVYTFVPQDEIRGREYWVYFVLSAHTLIEVLMHSQHLQGAVVLHEGRALSLANCPPKYKMLAEIVMRLKTSIPYLNQNQIAYIKYRTIPEDAKVEIPESVKKEQTAELDRIAGAINNVAVQVSEFPTFKEMIVKVLAICDGK